MKALAAAVCAGLAAWCSFGTIGLMGPGSTSSRVALLPPWWLLLLLVFLVFAAIRLLRLSPAEVAPLYGSAVVLLPWLPFPVPPAALLWTGPFVVAVWIAVVTGVVVARRPVARSPWLTDARRAPLAAAAIALVLYGASASWLAPILPEGDAPHYLIITQSLIKDGDLRIENNHRRGDYLEYSLLAAQPDYLRRGLNGAIYSIHSVGLSVVIAPVMLLFGYPGVVAFLGIIAAWSTAIVWRLSYKVTTSASAAWFGWACAALTTPFFFQATQVFPDGLAATFVLLGVLPLALVGGDPEERAAPETTGRHDTAIWMLSGASLAILPWLQTRIGIVAAAAAFCLCLRIRSRRQLMAFTAIPTASALGFFAFFYVIYGTPNPMAPFGSFTQTTVANLPNGVMGILFDEQFGLIPNAPVYGVLLAGLLVAAVKRQRWSWELLALFVPYVIGVGMYQHWWGGTSAPARHLAPLGLVLAIGGARLWHGARSSATRAACLMALMVSVLITAMLLLPDRGRLLFNFRDGVALWLEWGNDLLDLPKGVPSLFSDDPGRALVKTAIWTATFLAAWLAFRMIERRSRNAARPVPTVFLSWPAIWCLAAASMMALTLVWRIGGVQPLTPATSEIGLLRHASPFRSVAYDFGARRFETSRDLVARARIRSDRQRRPVSPAPLLSALNVPAGTYQLHVTSQGSAEGRLTLRIGDTPLPFWTAPASAAQLRASDRPIRLPADIRSLVVEGDTPAGRSISSVDLEPMGWPESSGAVAEAGSVHRAVHYTAGDVFFLDEDAYPEPTGFWVAGGRAAQVVIASTGSGRLLFLRNAPVNNTVMIDIDGERHEIALGAGEERAIALPKADPGGSASVRIKSQRGFRPSEADPGNQDLRYLGCWVEIR